MSDIQLKPCPFCGGEAEIYTGTSLRTYVFAQCKDCKARIRCIDEDINYCAKDKAVEMWNKRIESEGKQ